MITYRQPFQGEYPITQQYGEIIPGVTYKDEPHTGIDYGCPIGTPILASADGTVKYAGFDTFGFGNCVILHHADGKGTVYAHLAMVSVQLHQQVKQGEVIGYSGQTGNATGPHLHFEARSVWYDYKAHRDPISFLHMMSMLDPATNTERLPEGKYQVACSWAYIRTWDGLQRSRMIPKGEKVYIFEDVKYSEGGLPFRFIGANRCIAEFDSDGTKILEAIDGDKED